MDVIILSGGIGQRTKLNYPKQLFKIGDKPILIHVVELFHNLPHVDNIIVTIPFNLEDYRVLFDMYNLSATLIEGGKTRQESVRNALTACSGDRVIIHESARPFISKEFILSLLKERGDAVVPYIPTYTTLFNRDGYYLEREKVYNIQLPQVFNREILYESHNLANQFGRSYTDDSSLVFYEMNIRPKFVQGEEQNIKITTPLDIKVSEVIYEEYSNSDRW
jgi:2-C-methyl-D-erythritol 4-phosphate cytidylyltransferase